MNRSYLSFPIVTRNTRSSVIAISLIFCMVMLSIVGSMMMFSSMQNNSANRTLARETSFHLAESGIERAMYALLQNELESGAWVVDSERWGHISSPIAVSPRTGEYRVEIDKVNANTYRISSIGYTSHRNQMIPRAVVVDVEADFDEGEEGISIPGNPFIGILAKTQIGMTNANGVLKMASTSSSLTLTPTWLSDDDPMLGHNLSIVTTNPNPGANGMNLGNPTIYGQVATTGSSIDWFHGYRNSNEFDRNAQITNGVRVASGDPDIPSSGDPLWNDPNLLVDPSLVSTNSEVPTPPNPIRPSPDGYQVITLSQDFWQNAGVRQQFVQDNPGLPIGLDASGNLILGSLNGKVWINTPTMNLHGMENVTIQGEVILDCAQNLHMMTDVNIHGENSHFTLSAAQGNFNFIGNVASSKPSQFLLTTFPVFDPSDPEGQGSVTSPAVLVKSSRFNGIINTPNSHVQMAGLDDTQPMNNVYFGAVVCNTYEATNGFSFFYDEDLGGRSPSTEPGTEDEISSLAVANWREVYPSTVVFHTINPI